MNNHKHTVQNIKEIVKKTANQHTAIIPLNKLKFCMPQEQAFERGKNFLETPDNYRQSLNNSFDFLDKGKKQANTKAINTIRQSSSTGDSIKVKTPLNRFTPPQARNCLNQLAVTGPSSQETRAQQQQQEKQQQLSAGQRQGYTIVEKQQREQRIDLGNTSKTKRAVSGHTGEESSSKKRQDHTLAERKRKRTSSTFGSGSTKPRAEERKEGEQGYITDNMTPSSLLRIQSHNYTTEHQQNLQQLSRNSIYCTDNTLNHNIHNTQQHNQRDKNILEQIRTVTTLEDCIEGSSSQSNQQDSNQQLPQQQFTKSSIKPSPPSLSSHMLNNDNQIKGLHINCNPSIDSVSSGRNNFAFNNGSALTGSSLNTNSTDSANYISNQETVQQQGSKFDALVTVGANNFQTNFQTKSNLQSTNQSPLAGNSTFDNFNQSVSNSMLEQQLRIENSLNLNNSKTTFEGNIQTTNSNNQIQAGGSSTNSLILAKNIAEQQSIVKVSSYYNQYNLMPQPASDSTSPTSTTSTPSPKTSAMHSATASQHSNQHIHTSTNSSPQTHLEQLNQHYMNNNLTTSGMIQSQHHSSSQQYSYVHQHNSNNSNQNQTLSMSNNHDINNYASHHQQNHQHQQQLYNHIANNSASVNQIYANSTNNNQYQGHLQTAGGGHHQQNHLINGTHLNSAAAACAAAAVVSQTLKTVANQHNQQHHYGSAMGNTFDATSGGLVNMTNQHHQQFHNVNPLNHHHHHLGNQNSNLQQQNHIVHHPVSVVTRKYQCKMCPQVFMSKAEMKFHNQNHMREAKPYKCLQCPKAFANSSYLSQHMRIHQGVKPYGCDICSRKFTQLSHLQQHKRTHTGDKPYKCNYMNCTKQFSQLSNLQSHSRCHQLDKPYKCNSCYKCFHDEQSLLEHIPRHLESKHLKKNLCIFCGSSYQQERGLVKHFQQYHTDKSPTLVAAAIAAGTTGNTNLIASLVSSPPNVFAAPSNGSSNGGGSSSSSTSSSSSGIGNSGNLTVHNNPNQSHGVVSGGYKYVGGLIQ